MQTSRQRLKPYLIAAGIFLVLWGLLIGGEVLELTGHDPWAGVGGSHSSRIEAALLVVNTCFLASFGWSYVRFTRW